MPSHCLADIVELPILVSVHGVAVAVAAAVDASAVAVPVTAVVAVAAVAVLLALLLLLWLVFLGLENFRFCIQRKATPFARVFIRRICCTIEGFSLLGLIHYRSPAAFMLTACICHLPKFRKPTLPSAGGHGKKAIVE